MLDDVCSQVGRTVLVVFLVGVSLAAQVVPTGTIFRGREGREQRTQFRKRA